MQPAPSGASCCIQTPVQGDENNWNAAPPGQISLGECQSDQMTGSPPETSRSGIAR